MAKKILPGCAPIPQENSDIVENSMRLYTYLVCKAGLGKYPPNTRIFQQKNLVLSQINRNTGIKSPETVKCYLYFLEYHEKIIYKGEEQFDFSLAAQYEDSLYDNKKGNRDIYSKIKKYTAEVWKRRSKNEKLEYYWIPRPDSWTPIPEVTLEKLNSLFQVSENELKLYIFCCRYNDVCKKKYKSVTFEQWREILGVTLKNENNSNIRRDLLFLRSIGLIDFMETYTTNMKGSDVPCFLLKEVNYYIDYTTKETKDIVSDEDLKAVLERIQINISNQSVDTEGND